MIRNEQLEDSVDLRKPRASGDDPDGADEGMSCRG